jgi:DNA-binding response OmpR family regulator
MPATPSPPSSAGSWRFLPGLEVCRQLKSDSDLHITPVVFISSRGSLDDRLRGLALGADDYVTKPVQLPEVRLRIELTLRRRAAARDAADLALTYDCFVGAATHALRNGPAAMALVRISPGDARQVLTTASGELRRRDLMGRYDDTHVIVLLPGLIPADACSRLSALAHALAGRDIRIVAGIASTTGTASFQELLDEADDALAQARSLRQPVVIHGQHTPRAATPTRSTILIAEDDPDVMRILDAQLRAAGYQTLLVLLDLMMPRLTGFDVLTAVRQMNGRKPKIVVVSGRGRESDVTRAFGLGVDDYLTKPFSPGELVARLHRLTR